MSHSWRVFLGSKSDIVNYRDHADVQVLYQSHLMGQEIRHSDTSRLPCATRIAERLESFWEIRSDQLDVRRHGYRQCSATFGDSEEFDPVHLSAWYQGGCAYVSGTDSCLIRGG